MLDGRCGDVVYSEVPTGVVGRGIGWEYDLIYGEGLTGASPDSGRVVVRTLNGCG